MQTPTPPAPHILQYAQQDRTTTAMLLTARIIRIVGIAASITALAAAVVPLALMAFPSRLQPWSLTFFTVVTIILWCCQWILYNVWFMNALTIAQRLGRDVVSPAMALLLHLIPIVHLTGPLLVFAHLTAAPAQAEDADGQALTLTQRFRAWCLLWLAFWGVPILIYQDPVAGLLWLPLAIGLPLANYRLIRRTSESLTRPPPAQNSAQPQTDITSA